MEEQVMQKPRRRGWIWALGILLLLVLLLAGGWYYLFQYNQFALSLQLIGEGELLHEYGEPYEDAGATLLFAGSHVLREGIVPEEVELWVDSQVNTEKTGMYTVNYTAKFRRWEASASRSVRVVDSQPPVITLLDTSDETILPGTPYEEEGYIAIDNYDGDITDRVKRIEDLDMITYVVSDSSGNPTTVYRDIPYYDPLPPEIQLLGGEMITLPAGTLYQEPGFTATDNADGEITDRVEVEGEVLWYKPGTYTLTYRVSDVFENLTEVNRTVEVTAKPRVPEVYPPGKVIYLTFDDGPGPYTDALLDVLAHYGVKATFFVTDTGYNGTMGRIVRNGHSIGIHTATHNYQEIYASPEAYFADLRRIEDVIYRNTGVHTTLLRFPGGGSNLVSRDQKGLMTLLTQAVQDAGYQYFDWNVDSCDAGGATKKQTVVDNVIDGVRNQRVSVVLQHDIHGFSVAAVEDIIVWGLNNGYTFLPLKPDSPGMHHTVLN